MNFHLGQNPLLPWSIDQAAVIYFPPGAAAALSRGCHWCCWPPSRQLAGEPLAWLLLLQTHRALLLRTETWSTSLCHSPLGGPIGLSINFLSAGHLAILFSIFSNILDCYYFSQAKMGKVKYETSGFISNAMTDFHAAAHRDPLRKAEGSKQVLSRKKKKKNQLTPILYKKPTQKHIN